MRDIYFMVNTIHFSAEYVDLMSPADRSVFLRYWKEDDDRRRKSETNGGVSVGSPIDTMGAQ